ncbi:P-loop containing nucleoside triphosphate hydrolase protein [Entophlyctis helioformis]|nr:P-loop containing nucleoside triphosphate hydrolase protein [Entophlyctis helioformis]
MLPHRPPSPTSSSAASLSTTSSPASPASAASHAIHTTRPALQSHQSHHPKQPAKPAQPSPSADADVAAVAHAAALSAADDATVPTFGQQLARIWRLARAEYPILVAAVVLLCISSAVTMLVPFSMGTVIDIFMDSIGAPASDAASDAAPILPVPVPVPGALSPDPRLSEILRKSLSVTELFAALAGVLVIGGVANMGRVILIRTAAERIIARLRNRLFTRVIKQDVAFHDANRSGELISRLSTDTVVVGNTLTDNVSDGLRSLVTSVAGLTAMLYVNMTMMMIVPPVAMAAVFYGRFVRKLSKTKTDGAAEITKFAEEKISNLRTVRAFAQEEHEISRYARRIQQVYKVGMREAYASGLFFGGAGLSGNLVMFAVLYHGGMLVQEGLISVGELTSFFMYTIYVGSSLVGLTSWYSDLNKGIGASTRVFRLLESESTIESTATAPGTGRSLDAALFKGGLEFRDVAFNYPTRPDVDIFRGLSFTVSPGETIAIVGHSGSGKSTIAQLLLRFYDPTHGTVLLDGVPLAELNTHWLRSDAISLVPQEPVLFAATIRDNIRYGRPDATDEEVRAAAEQANAHAFISTFPDGYDTYVGERGAAISGGQKQRIAIARALLKNPRVLIMDEATSALDASSEYLVQEALDRLIMGRTVVTIAHRLSTIQKSDRVVMIDGGRVVEVGTFDELTSKPDGLFRELVQRQLEDPSALNTPDIGVDPELDVQAQPAGSEPGSVDDDAATVVNDVEKKLQ